MSKSMRMSLVLLFALGLSFNALAQKPRLLDKETFMDMESVGNPEISPDGKQIVFTRTWVDKVKDQSRSNLWIVDVDGNRVRELIGGARNDSSPVWSPDGKRIAFLSDRDGTNQLHVMWLDTREVAQLTHLEQAPSNIRWSPDGKQIAFTAFMADNDPILSVRLPERPRGAEWARPAVIVDRLQWRSDGRGPLPRGFTHVFTVDATLGGTPRQITNGKFNHTGFDWSPDGKTMYVSGIRKPDAEYLRNDSEIYSVNLATLEIKTLTDRLGPDGNPTVSPDGKLIAYVGYDDKRYTNHVSSLYLMNSDGTGKRLLAGNLPSSPQNLNWWADSKGIQFTSEEKGATDLFWVSLADGILRRLNHKEAISGFSIANNGQVAMVASNHKQPGVLITFPFNRMNEKKMLVDVNSDVLSGMKLGDAEELWYTSADGWKIQGWLIKPANFEPGKKYPMVLWIHGGPWSMYSVAWNWAFQNFAANGYAVLYTNPRGSTGYGQDFVNGIQYSYPGKDYDDLMAGVDEALKKGFIDDKNLFVCGGSGGGVLTAWIVGHTDRFAAAVSMRPVINWHSFVGTTDGQSWYYQFKKFPWEDPMEFAVRSPLHYVANVKTPTMVLTGEEDWRTPMSDSEQYYQALKLLGVESVLVRVPNEPHGIQVRPSHHISKVLHIIGWFDQHGKQAAQQAAR